MVLPQTRDGGQAPAPGEGASDDLNEAASCFGGFAPTTALAAAIEHKKTEVERPGEKGLAESIGRQRTKRGDSGRRLIHAVVDGRPWQATNL